MESLLDYLPLAEARTRAIAAALAMAQRWNRKATAETLQGADGRAMVLDRLASDASLPPYTRLLLAAKHYALLCEAPAWAGPDALGASRERRDMLFRMGYGHPGHIITFLQEVLPLAGEKVVAERLEWGGPDLVERLVHHLGESPLLSVTEGVGRVMEHLLAS